MFPQGLHTHIERFLKVPLRSQQRYITTFLTHGTCTLPKLGLSTKARSLPPANAACLIAVLNDDPLVTLYSLCLKLTLDAGVLISRLALQRGLINFGYTRKLLTKVATMSDPMLQQGYCQVMSAFHPSQSIYVDNTSKDKQDTQSTYGYSQQRTRTIALFSADRSMRDRLLAALSLDNFETGSLFQGAVLWIDFCPIHHGALLTKAINMFEYVIELWMELDPPKPADRW
ncbi:hypothetical protein JCM10450v2_001446 [Rhodotorula kratochvilovae]